MTHDQADLVLHRLAAGLQPDVAGILRLLERISQHDEAEALRDRLVELGAAAVLDREPRP